MDSASIFKQRIADAAVERRCIEILEYVRGVIAETSSEFELNAGIQRIKAEEKTRILKEDEQAMKAALEEKHDGEISGVGV